MRCEYLTFPSCEVLAASAEHRDVAVSCLTPFPRLQAHQKRIAALPRVGEWLGKRPQTPHDNVRTLKEEDFS